MKREHDQEQVELEQVELEQVELEQVELEQEAGRRTEHVRR